MKPLSVNSSHIALFMGASLAVGQFPMLYGLACVVLALFTGWIGGGVFNR